MGFVNWLAVAGVGGPVAIMTAWAYAMAWAVDREQREKS